ncbi:MAG: hypothetical protein ACK55O_01050 [Phycisphaerales bacterium]|jgi:hypothetical protein|nr:hypothetical protein [Phycisphaeraceae bacterium]
MSDLSRGKLLPTPSPAGVDRFRRGLLALVGAAGVATMSGCYFDGGPLWSADQGSYISTTNLPQTVSVMDLRTGQEVWSYDIPVDRKLVIDFSKGVGDPTIGMPDKMNWEEWPIDRNFGQPSNVVFVPPASARRVDVKIRSVPELPDTLKPKAPVTPGGRTTAGTNPGPRPITPGKPTPDNQPASTTE